MKQLCLFIFFCLSVSLSFGREKDTPQKGEGIYSFLRRHNRTEPKQYDEFIRLNKNKLGKSNSLLQGTVYFLPPLKVTTSQKKEKINEKKEKINEKSKMGIQPLLGTQPLFGEKYKSYEIKDNKLAGACFYLVSGHGGPDPGAIAKVDGQELHEAEYAYDIMLRLARCLLEHNATVQIIIQNPTLGIRDDKYLTNSRNQTCMGKEISSVQVARLKQQSNEINRINFKTKNKYQRAIFIHLDSRSKNKRLDVFFYYQNGKQNKAPSLKLAETMQKTFRNLYDKYQPDRGFSGTVSTRPLYVLRNTTPVSLFVELANMQNANDQKRFMSGNSRQVLANWLCAGFINDYQSTSH